LPSRINKFGSTSSYVTAHCKNIFIEKYTSNDAYTFMISSKDITHYYHFSWCDFFQVLASWTFIWLTESIKWLINQI